MSEETKNLEEQERKSPWTLLRKIGVGVILFCIITAGLSILGLGEASGESWGIPFFLFLIFVDVLLFVLGMILILIDLFRKEKKREKELKKEIGIQRKIVVSKLKRVVLILFILFLIWLVSGIFPPPFSLSFYLYQVALKTKNSFFCFISPFAFNFGREQCYLDLAIEKKDLSLCDKTHSQYYCYQRIAEITKDASICKELPPGFSDDCYRDVAETRQEPSLCEKITNSEKKDYCYRAIAKIKKDPIFCEKIMDSWEKDNCYYNMAVFEKKDSTICGKIFREDFRERCYEKTKSFFPNETIEDKITDWKTYISQELGIDFELSDKFIEVFGIPYKTFEDKGRVGKRIGFSFGPPEKYRYTGLMLTAYTPDYEHLTPWPFHGWIGAGDVTKTCSRPLEYKPGDTLNRVCKIIEIAGEKAIFETSLSTWEASCGLGVGVYFNNRSDSSYKGLNFGLALPDVEDRVCKFFSVTEEDYEKLKSEFYSQSKNIMENKNLSERDEERLKLFNQILSTFRFFE